MFTVQSIWSPKHSVFKYQHETELIYKGKHLLSITVLLQADVNVLFFAGWHKYSESWVCFGLLNNHKLFHSRRWVQHPFKESTVSIFWCCIVVNLKTIFWIFIAAEILNFREVECAIVLFSIDLSPVKSVIRKKFLNCCRLSARNLCLS